MEELKLITQTKKGTLIKSPVTIERKDGRIFFIKSPFSLKDEIKAMKGSRWHGFIPDDGRKIWSVEDCYRNNFQLDFMAGGNPYENWDQPLKHFEYSRGLWDHQKLMADHCLTYHYQILAAEMGCIDGDAVVHCNRAGKGFSLSLRELCYKFHGGATYKGPTYIRGFRGSGLGLTRILDVVFKGVKKVVKVTFESGKELICTPDHELCVGAYRYGTFVPARQLSPGDTVMVSAPKGYSKNTKVAQTPPKKLEKTTKQGVGCFIDKDGYVRVSGLRDHYRNNNGQVYEHILVMEELLGRKIQTGECVHHLNHQRWDNRPCNLTLVSSNSRHARIHSKDTKNNVFSGKPDVYYFTFEKVVSVEDAGETDVYDVVCEGPYHNFVADGVVVHNCGKTLSAIEVMELSGVTDWWWVAPKSGLAAVEREFEKWGLKVQPRVMTYERLRIEIERWEDGMPAPQGVIFDESSRLKTATSKRTKAAMHLADSIRDEHGWNGFVILMSGTPAPKSPVDWWAQCEVCYPGFLKEGSAKAFEWRLGFFEKQMTNSGEFWKRKAWRDDETRCEICGEYKYLLNEDDEVEGRWVVDDNGAPILNPCHDTLDIFGDGKAHEWKPSKNEVAYVYERLDGLVLPLAKKDCLDIPDKIYREVNLEPSSTIKRVARALAQSAVSAIQGLTWLRELSDGFQYREKQVGEIDCKTCNTTGKAFVWEEGKKQEDVCEVCGGKGKIPNMVRETKQIQCPKDQAVRDLLEENEDQGRIVLFAGFQGSIDRIVGICHKQQWNVVKVDGRGWKILPCDDTKIPKTVKPLSYWANLDNPRVAFVAHPESGGMGLTLTESRMAVFYSNDFKPESRMQAEDRIHRPGIDENKGATIVDLFHLGTDRKVLSVLRDNRRLEKLTLGEVQEAL